VAESKEELKSSLMRVKEERKAWDKVEMMLSCGTWNVMSMNQGNMDVVMQEMEKMNINILGISGVK